MHPEFQLISCEQAIKQYHIQNMFFESEEAFFNMVDRDSYFYIHTSNLCLSGNFILDTDMLGNSPDDKSIHGFIVIGNLDVTGSIINDNCDYGPMLYVTGNVSCLSMLIGGAPVRLKGNVYVTEIIMFYYNHGWARCDGTFIAPVMLVDDYHLLPAKIDIDRFYYNNNDPNSPIDNNCYIGNDGNIKISQNLHALLNNLKTTEFDELIRDIAAGERVLKKQDLTNKYWQQKVRVNWRDLKRVPLIFRTIELCLEAFEQYPGALAYFPEELINESLAKKIVFKNGIALRYLPYKFITSKLCYIAAKNGAVLGIDIPEEFYQENLLSAVIERSDWQMERVPISFITEDLLVLYVKNGRGAWLDRYCKQSGISKQTVLEQIISIDMSHLDNIFSWHLSVSIYTYAKQLYDQPAHQAEWKTIMHKYENKIKCLI